jgi:polycomb protein SUZ12
MGPKTKRDRISTQTSTSTNSTTSISKNKDDRLEQLQADHELFLQAFESKKKTGFPIFLRLLNKEMFILFSEPTQIYRYLRTRNLISPIFLNRTLTFMKRRISRPRSDKARLEFKVDSLLKRKESETKETEPLNMDRFMNVTFLGYYDRDRETDSLFTF